MATTNGAWRPLVGPAFDGLMLAARLCLGFQFLFFGSRKFLNPPSIAAMISSHGLPGDLVYLVIPFQIGLGTLVILGLFTRVGAVGLAFFCTFAPAIFWATNLDNFTRDFGSACGFWLLYAAGPGRLSLDNVFGVTCESIFGRRDADAKEWGILSAVARIYLSLEFFGDALRKIFDVSAAGNFFAAHGWPPSLVYPAILLEVLFALLLVVGYRTRPLAIAGWLTAFTFAFFLHGPAGTPTYFTDLFWGMSGFGGIPKWIGNFAKDFGTLGAFAALYAYGPGAFSLDAKCDASRNKQAG